MFDVPPSAATAVMLDAFPVACFATDRSRIIRYENAEAASLFGFELGHTIGLHIEAVLTPASKIFCNSYVYPLLLADGCCEELALTLVTQTGSRVPVVANARMHGSEYVLWSAMRAEKREKLQGEVLSARNALQGQTGPVTVWCRSFDHVMCSKGDEPWAQAGRINFARMRCGSPSVSSRVLAER